MQPRLPAYNATTSFPPAPAAQLFGAAPFVRSLHCSQTPGACILFDLDSCFHVDGLHFAGQNSVSLMEKVLRLRRVSCVGGLVPTAWHLQDLRRCGVDMPTGMSTGSNCLSHREKLHCEYALDRSTAFSYSRKDEENVRKRSSSSSRLQHLSKGWQKSTRWQ